MLALVVARSDAVPNVLRRVDLDTDEELPNVAQSLRRPVLTTMYLRYLNDEDTAGFVNAVSQRYTVAVLEKIVLQGSLLARRAATMALGFLGDIDSTPVMTRALHDQDCGVRLLAETGLRELWCRDGGDGQRERLRILVHLNLSELYDVAVEAADELIAASPWIAEAWNQRAIALFNLQEFDDSARDCEQALARNPYHYAAAVGLANCHLERKNPKQALVAFRHALELNPDLDSVRSQIELLEQEIEDSREKWQ